MVGNIFIVKIELKVRDSDSLKLVLEYMDIFICFRLLRRIFLFFIAVGFKAKTTEEILKNGTVDFVSISYYSSNCVSVTKKGKITAANGGENIKNPYLEASAWGWQIDVLLVQKSH